MTQQIANIIHYLETVRQKPGMFLNDQTPHSFLLGFDCAAVALGLAKEVEQKRELYRKIVVERGWEYNLARHLSSELEEQGLSYTQIIDEVLQIEIEAWKRLYRSLCTENSI